MIAGNRMIGTTPYTKDTVIYNYTKDNEDSEQCK